MERVEQIDDIARVVVQGRCGRIAGTAVDAAKMWGDHTPAAAGQRELSLPHPRVEGKRVKKHDDAARPFGRRRRPPRDTAVVLWLARPYCERSP